MGTKDRQVGGDHYRQHEVQPWDIVEMYGLNFFTGNALKYLLRIKGDRIQDLEKCKHYIEKEIENVKRDRQALGLADFENR